MDKKFYETFGWNVRRVREADGFLQRELSDNLEMSRTSMAMVEGGKYRVPFDLAVRIGEELGVTVLDLLDDARITDIVAVRKLQNPIEKEDWLVTKGAYFTKTGTTPGSIGDLIRKKRFSQALTLTEVGEMARMKPGTIGRIEQDLHKPSLMGLFKLFRALGIGVEELAETNEWKEAGS